MRKLEVDSRAVGAYVDRLLSEPHDVGLGERDDLVSGGIQMEDFLRVLAERGYVLYGTPDEEGMAYRFPNGTKEPREAIFRAIYREKERGIEIVQKTRGDAVVGHEFQVKLDYRLLDKGHVYVFPEESFEGNENVRCDRSGTVVPTLRVDVRKEDYLGEIQDHFKGALYGAE